MLFIYLIFYLPDEIIGELYLIHLTTSHCASSMEKNCDTNQNLCDIDPIHPGEKKILRHEKEENPSKTVQTLSAILPSNFLNLSPRFY